MKKKKAPRKAPQSRKRKKSRKKKPNRLRFFLVMIALAIAAMAGAYFYLTDGTKPEERRHSSPPPVQAPVRDPQFVKEGELRFFRGATRETLAKIDIEIADNPLDIEAGLMHRRSMAASAGMLFIFPGSAQRMFWMKNTHIPLDILFIDEHRRIHHIEKNTRPLSEVLIPSRGSSRYVVEVNAGFCDARGVRVGDTIEFRKGG